MTYCIGILVDDGLVMMADTRTNAGIDHISVFRKLHVFQKPGKMVLMVAASGNLSVTQSVLSFVTEGLKNPDTGKVETLLTQPTVFKAAQLLGRALREVYRIDGHNLEQMAGGFEANLLVGGQIGDNPMRLFHIYAAGNFIEVTPETPFFQIGEHKYGKPILDRIIRYNTDPRDALKTAMISMDATMRSNLSVGPPVDAAVLRKNALECEVLCRIEEDDSYFIELRKAWAQAMQDSHNAMPLPPYGSVP
jgi:putative proteasome-type protease